MPVRNYKAYYAANRERFQAYHRKHYKTHRVQRLASNKARRAELQARVNNLKFKPCMDCEWKFDVHCMQFDHRDPKQKLFSIATAVAQCYEWSRIEQEIKKCDLVCANCHAVRTWRQRHGRNGL